ncbi:g3088 [Coccomyxa elongata]
MALNKLKEFLRSINEDYVRYAEHLHQGTFTNKAELSAADRSDLEALTVPKGAAGLIIQAAKGTVYSGEAFKAVAAFVPFLQALVIQENLHSDLSTGIKQQREVKFKLDSYNYYFKQNAATLPSRITCMVTGRELETRFIVAGHVFPTSKQAAWRRCEIAIFRDRATGKLYMRVLTDVLMSKSLLDYIFSSGGGCAYSMRKFADYDYAELMVTDDAMPYRRLLLHQAVCAVSYQSARGHLREGISVNADDYEVASDFDKKPDVERWIKTMFAQAL